MDELAQAQHRAQGQLEGELAVTGLIVVGQKEGAKHLIVPIEDEPAGYDRAAELFNRVGRQCAGAGRSFLWQPHAWEFAILKAGGRGFDRLLAGPDAALGPAKVLGVICLRPKREISTDFNGDLLSIVS